MLYGSCYYSQIPHWFDENTSGFTRLALSCAADEYGLRGIVIIQASKAIAQFKENTAEMLEDVGRMRPFSKFRLPRDNWVIIVEECKVECRGGSGLERNLMEDRKAQDKNFQSWRMQDDLW
jgi:hypothetical protein